MTRGQELMGMPVIELDSGKQVGVVEDLLLDVKNSKMKALLIKSGTWLEGCQELDIKHIHKLGPDTITIMGCPMPAGMKEEREAGVMSIKGLQGKRIIDTAGKEIGTLEDVVVNQASGDLAGWEVSDGIIQDIIEGRKHLPLEAVNAYGEDRVIIREGVGTG